MTATQPEPAPPSHPSHPPPRRIAITGTGGRLGGALARCWSRPRPDGTAPVILPLDRASLPLDRPERIEGLLAPLEFDALVHCAAITNVDQCEQEPDLTHRVNALAPAALAAACARRGARLLHVSTDYVLAGRTPGERREADPCEPINIYGQAKLEAEQAVLALHPDATVARVSWVFGPDKPSFIDSLLQRALDQPEVAAITGKWSTPSYTDDLAAWFDILLRHPDSAGLIHTCNRGACTWQELGQFALDTARQLGVRLRASHVAPLTLADFPSFKAARPIHTALATDRLASLLGHQVPTWQDAVRRYLESQRNSGTSFLSTAGAIG